ncbi:MAG: Fic family protein, partial [Candidatus Moraniibacteriota bacterium]
RQALILDFIDNNTNAQTQSIREYLTVSLGNDISRMTVIRDIEVLLTNDFIQKKGLGRSVVYKITPKGTLLSPIDSKIYFEKSPDQRVNTKKTFQQDIFESMEYLFSAQEFLQLDTINDGYRKRVSALSPTALRKEFERLTIELSWKSSQIEGNTYSLIDTEILLRQRKEAEGHKKEEAIMLINHKRAIEYIHENASMFETLSLRNIEDVHAILIEGLGVTRGLRKNIVGITGTVYRPLDNEFQVREAMEQMIKTINGISHPLWKALVLVLLLSYIQPFEDGNKRTARLIGNAILLAYNYCPLSYRSVDEGEYKKAVLLFYEKNNASMFKKIFVDQFEFAVENYF